MMDKLWAVMDERERLGCLTRGIVPLDYASPVAADWPDLLSVVETRVKPERLVQRTEDVRLRWWQYQRTRPALRAAIAGCASVIAITQTSPHLGVSILPNKYVFDQSLVIFPNTDEALFALLQSRVHEIWVRFFAATLEERLRYIPTDCFSTFPFPEGRTGLGDVTAVYVDHRRAVMKTRNEGLTRVYNRFHDVVDTTDDVIRLRELHAHLDQAVLHAYGWGDLAATAAPEFLTEETEQDHRYQSRLFWPAPFRDEVLARLLALNAERAADEAARGLVPAQSPIGADELEEA